MTRNKESATPKDEEALDSSLMACIPQVLGLDEDLDELLLELGYV